MPDQWIISDNHFGHRLCARLRGFLSEEEEDPEVIERAIKQMDEVMIDNWNSVVKPNDIVRHLGDFTWRPTIHYAPLLNGVKHLVLGNHDKRNDYHNYFASVQYYAEIRVEKGLRICCSHYAMRVWNCSHYGNLHCYGHSHGKLPGIGRSMDVGVDTNNLFPYHIDEVIAKLKALPIISRFEEPEDDAECAVEE
jgi:calcineurin-like phosphoesterase family protein